MVGQERIYPVELLLLGLWLSGPALLLGLGAEAALLWRAGLRGPGERRRLGMAVLLSGLLAYIVTVAVWILVPPQVMAWPGTFGDWPFMFLGVLFVPTLLALLIVCPAAGWWALQKRRSSRTRS
jgi:hypothetical protein